MKLLFLTTYNVLVENEHVFTRNVWNELSEQFSQTTDEIAVATIFESLEYTKPLMKEEEYNGKKYYKLYFSSFLSDEEKVEELARFLKCISPDVIHSNMVEVIDVKAARACNIPIVLTIHIGGFMCPRGGGNGLLKFDDSICNTAVGKHCFRCCAKDLPLPLFARFLYWCIPSRLREFAYRKLRGKHIFYLTEFLTKSHEIILREESVNIYKYATIIVANKRLKDVLALNGLTKNIVLLPHGVKPRPKLLFPEVKDVVKFYYLGRIQYGKGLHNLLKSFKGIDTSLYELNIIGDASSSRRGRRYEKMIRRMSLNKNVCFLGKLPNESLESVIKDMHVMIHPGNVLEVYGLTIAESLSIGRPVLATRCGGAEMQIQDGVNGWLVAPNNIEVLHNKIIEIIQHKDEIALMSSRCFLPHPISEYCKSLLSIYEKSTNINVV